MKQQIIKKPYNDYSSYLKKEFAGERVQKISIDAGFTCPNRDGTKARGGCTYCNNESFTPAYCSADKTISRQLEEGVQFFSKTKASSFLAYFQSYTNTYANLTQLKMYYREALEYPGVRGLVIGTRPDCVSEELLDYLEELAKKYYIHIEYGLESTLDRTLTYINRGHFYHDFVNTIKLSSGRGIKIGLHLILALPGESRKDILSHSEKIANLSREYSIDTIKLHQLQILKGTVMEKQWEEESEKFHFYSLDEYLDLVIDFLERLNPNIVVERFVSQASSEMLLAPHWGRWKNFEIAAKLQKRMIERGSFQGKKY